MESKKIREAERILRNQKEAQLGTDECRKRFEAFKTVLDAIRSGYSLCRLGDLEERLEEKLNENRPRSSFNAGYEWALEDVIVMLEEV